MTNLSYLVFFALLFPGLARSSDFVPPSSYPDGRPATKTRLEASGAMPIIRHGSGPQRCDYLGAREAICFKAGSTYYLHYDGAGPTGWLACLATSKDIKNWNLHGPVLTLGGKGSDDEGTASSPWTIYDGSLWHMFYVGSQHTTPAPDRIPAVPYFTLTATSKNPGGPWTKKYGVVPFKTQPGTYYADTASPGQVVRDGGEYLMFFSAAAYTKEGHSDLKRTLSIANTTNLNGAWQIDAQPILPPDQQIENSALYFERANQTWFLFTNHIGLDKGGEYTEAIWVYWSKDLRRWNAQNRAVVLDRANCKWSGRAIGMPSVVKVGDRLALFYDASTSATENNMGRDVGIAWLNLPLRPPVIERAVSRPH